MALLVATYATADVIVLKNGDRITAALVKKDGDRLTARSEFLGDINLPWSAVASIEVEEPVYVELMDGQKLNGTLDTESGEVRVATPVRQIRTSLPQILAIRNGDEQRKFERLFAPSWFELWAGYFDIGFALARGNARTNTFSTAFEMIRPTRTDKTRVYLNQIYSTATVDGIASATADAVRAGWAYNHDISGRTFFSFFNDYENNNFQNLDLRFVAGGGLGVHLIKSDRTILDVLGGASYNRENFSRELARNSGEAYWGDDFRHAFNSTTSVTQSFRMFNNVTDAGAYRMNFDVGTATALRRWLSFHITGSDRFLSNPVFGRQRNDILLTTGFRVSFAR
jgi:hypothetical protein